MAQARGIFNFNYEKYSTDFRHVQSNIWTRASDAPPIEVLKSYIEDAFQDNSREGGSRTNFVLDNRELLEKEVTLIPIDEIRSLQNCLFILFCYQVLQEADLRESAYRSKKSKEYAEAIEKLKARYEVLKTQFAPPVLPAAPALNEQKEEKELKEHKTANDHPPLSAEAIHACWFAAFCQYLQKMLARMWENLKKGVSNLTEAICKYLIYMTNLKTAITMLNLYRIFWVFCRLTLVATFTWAAEQHHLQTINEWMHTKMKNFMLHEREVELEIIKENLNRAALVMNFLSVGIFCVRLLMTTIVMAQHVWRAPKGLGLKTFFEDYIVKQFLLYNDFLWPIINLLCNFKIIAETLAIQLTAAALLFDVINLSVILFAKYRAHKKKEAQLAAEKNDIDAMPEGPQKQAMLEDYKTRALNEKVSWINTKYYLGTGMLAGTAMILFGFSAAFLFGPAPLILTAISLVGVALYLSAEALGKWAGASARLKEYKKSKVVDKIVEDKLHTANTNAAFAFFKALTLHIIVPAVVITCLAVSWELTLMAGAVALVGYLFYKKVSGCGKTAESGKKKPDPAPALEQEPSMRSRASAIKDSMFGRARERINTVHLNANGIALTG